MICLVTGAGGFIGSHLVDTLVESGHTVYALDDLSGGYRENISEKARYLEGSITDAAFIDRVFSETGFDYVFHLAAYAAEGLSHFIKHYNYQNNLIGSVNLINASVRTDVQHFVFTSSIAVYGHGQNPVTEAMQPSPEDPYAIAKLAVEQELKVTHEMFGLPYTIFRPHNVYGERQNIADPYRNVVGIFMNQLLQNKPMTIFGDGEQQRAFTYIGDIIGPIASCPQLPEAKNQVFNIGSDTPTSVRDLAAIVATAMNKPVEINWLPERNEVKNIYADQSNCRRVFENVPEIELTVGIRRMADWVLQTGPRELVPFPNIEIRKNLPPSWA